MTKRFRWGSLRTGWIADLFVKDLLLTGHQVSSVGSRTQESADRFAARFDISFAHGSHERLVADPVVDIVYVATPHPMHAGNATAALNAGKHVLIEKPFAVNAAEARGIVDLAKARKLVVPEAMWTRFLPHMARSHLVAPPPNPSIERTFTGLARFTSLAHVPLRGPSRWRPAHVNR